MRVVRRTFEAKNHPSGSEERASLNRSWLTSEYLPGTRYGIVNDDGTPTCWTFNTKREAECKLRIEQSIKLQAK